jgi:hypothetical protein
MWRTNFWPAYGLRSVTTQYCANSAQAHLSEQASCAAKAGYEAAESYLIGRLREASPQERARSKEALLDIVDELGQVVDSYPSWHPLVRHHDDRYPVTTPSRE